MTADDRGALAHAGQPEVTGHWLPLNHRLVDPLPIVTDGQAELPRFVADRDDDLARLRVLERVAQRLARNAIRFVTDDGIEIA